MDQLCGKDKCTDREDYAIHDETAFIPPFLWLVVADVRFNGEQDAARKHKYLQ